VRYRGRLSCFWTGFGVHIRMAIITQATWLRIFVAETPWGPLAPPWDPLRGLLAPPWENPGRGDGSFSNGLTGRGALAGIRAAKNPHSTKGEESNLRINPHRPREGDSWPSLWRTGVDGEGFIENWALVIAPPKGIADSRNDGPLTPALSGEGSRRPGEGKIPIASVNWYNFAVAFGS
jgi:hypothetical protein